MQHAASAIMAVSLCLSAAASEVRNLTMPSRVLGEDKTLTVYLPDGYEDGDRSYPVLYLLHGAWGTDRDWTEKGTMQEIADLTIRSGAAAPMIVVMPDARGTDENFAGPHMGYFDVPGWNYAEYFFDELIPYVESNFRVVSGKRNRAVAGLSMGGGGAVAYGQRHPEYWGSVCSLSGALGNTKPFNGDPDNDFHQSLARYDQTRYVREATPEQVEELKTVRWYADCGDDDFLWDSNTAFFRAMKEKDIPIEYRMRDGWHSWTYWRTALPDVLTFVSATFPRP